MRIRIIRLCKNPTVRFFTAQPLTSLRFASLHFEGGKRCTALSILSLILENATAAAASAVAADGEGCGEAAGEWRRESGSAPSPAPHASPMSTRRMDPVTTPETGPCFAAAGCEAPLAAGDDDIEEEEDDDDDDEGITCAACQKVVNLLHTCSCRRAGSLSNTMVGDGTKL